MKDSDVENEGKRCYSIYWHLLRWGWLQLAGLVQSWAAIVMGILSGSIPWWTMMVLHKKSTLLQKVLNSFLLKKIRNLFILRIHLN